MRYRIKVIDSFGRLIAKRTYFFQRIGKLAAISLPTAEMLRMRDECDGNLNAAFDPLRKALSGAGYTDILILPAQTSIVELIPIESDIPTSDAGFVELEKIKSAMREFALFRAEFEADLAKKLTPSLKRRYELVCRLMAEMELELWQPPS